VSESTQDDGRAQAASGTTTARTALLAVAGTVVGLALIGLVVALVVVLVRYNDVKDDAQRERAAVRDAREAAYDIAVDMSTYSYRSIEQDFAWFDERTTDDFQETFGPSVEDSRSAAEEFEIQAKAKVGRIAAERNEDGTVTVLAFVDQSIKAGDRKPNLALARLEITMVERESEWLADDATLHNPGEL